MFLLKRYAHEINAAIGSNSKRARALAIICILLFCSALSYAILSFAPPVMNGRPWDVPALLDGGWRIFNGQIPFHDFFSHHGPLAYYLTAAGMKIHGPSLAMI